MSNSINKLITIERHIAENEAVYNEATGEFSRLLRDLTLAMRVISREVRRAGLNDILGETEKENVHGEQVKKLDEFAHNIVRRAMNHGGHLCAMASEEADGIIPIPDVYECGKYVLLFDPLDGSSNIEVNVSIGTIFSVYQRIDADATTPGKMNDLLQPGFKQVAAGYCLYGSCTNLVYTTGAGVNIFTFDPTLGEFFLTKENHRMPEFSPQYSINEGYYNRWDESIRKFVNYAKSEDDNKSAYGLRYIGTAVADIHRILLHGGLFLYPADTKNPEGKLRLLYELNPLGMLVEQAGGLATDGSQRILEIQPETIHQRRPVFMGSKDNVNEVLKFLS